MDKEGSRNWSWYAGDLTVQEAKHLQEEAIRTVLVKNNKI